MQVVRYVILSLSLGTIAVWGSENWFWFAPPSDLTLVTFGLTVLVYSLAAACAVSAVILTGVRGWTAAFLGGAIVGYCAEGVVVGTIYDEFPIYMVWTPLAWHALLTGGVVLGLGRADLTPLWRTAVWLAFGLFGSYWAQYWPAERPGLTGGAPLALYLIGAGGLVVAAQLVLDRIGDLPRPRLAVLLVAPGLVALVWLWQTVTGFVPQRLALPAVLLLIVWMMRRAGRAATGPDLGHRAGWQHGLFLIAPLTATALAPILWAQDLGTLAANWVTLIVTALLSLGALARLAYCAVRPAAR